MTTLLRNLWNDEAGQDLAEYALLIALVALAAVAGVTLLGDNILARFNEIAGQLGGGS